VVVTDAGLRAELAESWFEPHREMYAIEQSRIEALRLTPLREFASTAAFKSAPVLVAVLGDRRTYQATVLGAPYLATEGASDAIYLKNMANAAQNINLAAAAADLGAMWISITRVWADSIRRILDVPDMLEVHTMIALGYPAYQPKPASRRPLADIVHYDKYDSARYRSAEDIQAFLYNLRANTEIPYKQGYTPGKE
jgi:nitroreductase